MLGIGFFLHTISVPIVRNNKNQENNIRDVTLGYTLVYITYIFVGTFGYIGFVGTFFTSHFQNQVANGKTEQIEQDCITMFETTNVLAFFMRIALFLLLFCCFPMVNHFFRSMTFQILFKG